MRLNNNNSGSRKCVWGGGLAVLIAAICGCSRSPSTLNELKSGGTAPELKIAHWVTDAQGRFEPITKFKPGQVYVVEFWATWCPPCRATMPHLSQLQQRYENEVQIISVSDEDLATVEQFLDTPADASGTTFRKIASQYCLTTDPDRSTYEDYMEAAGVNSIPHAFIVDKKSKIVWSGHPGEMDAVLEQVVTAP